MGLFDFVDSIFDPNAGSGGFLSTLVDEFAGSAMGGLSSGFTQPAVSFPQAFPVSYPVAQPVAASVPMAARAIAAGLPAWASRFPNLWQALGKLRASGSRMSLEKLNSGLRKWGPSMMAGLIGAQAVSELISYNMSHKRRRMNPANTRALRRSLRRLNAFDNLSHRVSSQLAASCRRGPRRHPKKCK